MSAAMREGNARWHAVYIRWSGGAPNFTTPGAWYQSYHMLSPRHA